MRITPGMPLEEGGTVETHGALLDLADFQDDDGTGVKVTISQERVRVHVDSYSPWGKSVWLNEEDANALGHLLSAKAAELRKEMSGAVTAPQPVTAPQAAGTSIADDFMATLNVIAAALYRYAARLEYQVTGGTPAKPLIYKTVDDLRYIAAVTSGDLAAKGDQQ